MGRSPCTRAATRPAAPSEPRPNFGGALGGVPRCGGVRRRAGWSYAPPTVRAAYSRRDSSDDLLLPPRQTRPLHRPLSLAGDRRVGGAHPDRRLRRRQALLALVPEPLGPR